MAKKSPLGCSLVSRSDLKHFNLLKEAHPEVLADLTPFRLSIPAGWIPLLNRLCVLLKDHGQACDKPVAKIFGVNEKGGQMQVFLTSADDDQVIEIVESLVRESTLTCRVCSARASKSVIAGKMYVVCKVHLEALAGVAE